MSYCIGHFVSSLHLKTTPQSNQTVQSQQCNLVASTGNYLIKTPFLLFSFPWISHKVYGVASLSPISSFFFLYPSNSYSGGGLHFSLPSHIILSIYMNHKSNTAETSGLLSRATSNIAALLMARMSQLNLGPLTYSCNSSAARVMNSGPPQLSAILF